MTTSIWLCTCCGGCLQAHNLKYGALTCDKCGALFKVGEDVQVMHETYAPPTPDPESDDE